MKKAIALSISILMFISFSILANAENLSSSEILSSDNYTYPLIEMPDSRYDINFFSSLQERCIVKENQYKNRTRTRYSYPVNVNLNVSWSQQQNNYYCGPATAVMILNNFMTSPSQSTMASSSYLRTDTYRQTPWFSGAADMENNIYYFSMAYGLNKWQYDNLGSYLFAYSVCINETKDTYISKIIDTLANDFPVPLNGKSLSTSISSGLKNYPSGHWAVI